MRRFVMASGLGIAGFALVACTGLLGDFEVSTSSAPVDGSTGSLDGGDLDGAGPGDAASDANLPPLVCKPSAAPSRLDVSGNGINFIPPIRAVRSGNQSRAVVQKKGTPGFTIITFGSGGGTQVNAVPPLGSAFTGTVWDAQPIPGGIGVLVQEPVPTGGTHFVLWKVLDNGGGAVTDVVSANLSAAASAGLTGATFSAFGADDYYIVATFDVGASTSELRAARRKQNGLPGAFQVVASGPSGGDTRVKEIVHVGNFAFLFNDRGPEQGRPGAASYFRVPDEPTSPSNAQATALTPAGGKPIAMFAAGAAPTGLRLAVGEVDFQAGTARLLAGTLGPVDLAPVDVSKLKRAYDLTSFFDAPVQGGDSRWLQSDFIAIGSSLGGGGLNLFWYDGQNEQMRVALVGAQKLVPDRTPTYSTLAPRSLVGGLADFDVVWSEAPPNDQSPGTLWTQEIVCARAN